MPRTIDLLDDKEGYDNRLHIEDDQAIGASFPDEVLDYMERRIREMNGGDQVKPLCGGCIFGVLHAMFKLAMQRGDATYSDAAGWARTMKADFAKLEEGAMLGGLLEGDDAKIFAEDQQMIYERGRRRRVAA